MRLIKKANLRIKGTGNEFVCPKDVHNELLKYGNVRIDGNNNKINIGGPNYLKFTDIKIFGNKIKTFVLYILYEKATLSSLDTKQYSKTLKE